MSKRHQASRRRNYGRRQHELHERDERSPQLRAEACPLDSGERGTGGGLGRFGLSMAGSGHAFFRLD